MTGKCKRGGKKIELNHVLFYDGRFGIPADQFISLGKRADPSGECDTDKDCEDKYLPLAGHHLECVNGVCYYFGDKK